MLGMKDFPSPDFFYGDHMNAKREHTGRGKWAMHGVPKKGWSCVDVEDLEEPSETCGMCESVEIRYVHCMEHPEYPDTLRVGCVCAEHMEQDYVRPKEREKKLRLSAARRKRWRDREWRTSAKGNSFLNVQDYNLTVFKDPKGWGVQVANRTTDKKKSGKKRFPNEDAAKLAAFDALLWAQDNL